MAIKIRKYYTCEKQLKVFSENIKLYDCPHCKSCGVLNLHGYLYGNAQDTGKKRIKRGFRIFCNNRRKKGNNGCGHTISVLASFLIKSFTLTTGSLWTFLSNLKHGLNRLRAFSHSDMVTSSIYRIYQRFKHNQARIRTLLMRIEKPPDLIRIADPVIATIIHLESVFNNDPNTVENDPIQRFQHGFDTCIF